MSLIQKFINYSIQDLRDRLEAKFIPEPNTGCWLWFGRIDANGYGKLSFCGRPAMAHRIVYEMHCEIIPDGLCLDHLCRNRSCVNPDHLEPVTLGENTRRGHVGEINRARLLAKTHCKYGHPLSGDNLYIVQITGQRVCLACKTNRKRQYNARIPKKPPNRAGLALGGLANGKRQRAKTHCPHGHPYNEKNGFIEKATGYRGCRECHRLRSARARQEARASTR